MEKDKEDVSPKLESEIPESFKGFSKDNFISLGNTDKDDHIRIGALACH